MNQVDSRGTQKDDSQSRPLAVQVASFTKADDERYVGACGATEDEGNTQNRGYWNRLWREKPDRHIELGLTLAISFFALVQLIVSCNNNNSTSQQTQQLITAAEISATAAKQNAQAARDFSGSARSINNGISDAVDRLRLQASATEAARESSVEESERTLKTTIEQSNRSLAENINNFQLDQRPWIGIQSITIDQHTGISLSPQSTYSVTTLALGDSKIVLVNTGKTPATILSFVGVAYYGNVNLNELPSLRFSSISSTNMLAVKPAIVIPTQTFTAPFTGAKEHGAWNDYPVGRFTIQLDYADVWKHVHHTKICIITYLPILLANTAFVPIPEAT